MAKRPKPRNGQHATRSAGSIERHNSLDHYPPSKKRVEDIVDRLMREGRMPGQEAFMQLRARAVKKWQGVELVFGTIRGGAGTETLVFIPAERAQQLAAIHKAIGQAKTWGEFRLRISAEDWNELVRCFDEYDEAPQPGDAFNAEDVPGFTDGDWPDWPEQEMMSWLPPEHVARFGTQHQSVLNGPFLSFDPKYLNEIMAELKRGGYTCRREDVLISQACGRGNT